MRLQLHRDFTFSDASGLVSFPVNQTATPVQLDQVLTSLQSDSREDLKSVLDGVSNLREVPRHS